MPSLRIRVIAGMLGALGAAAGAAAEPLPAALSGATAGSGMVDAIGKGCAPGHPARCRRARAAEPPQGQRRDRAVARPDAGEPEADATPFHGWYVGINGGYGWARQ